MHWYRNSMVLEFPEGLLHRAFRCKKRASTCLRALCLTIVCWVGASSPSSAQDLHVLDDFVWKKDQVTGNEIAASRSDPSFNFFDVGDLSSSSEHTVEQDLRRISAAAGLTLDKSISTKWLVSIFHDSNVFSRLKHDKPAFGLPNNVLDALEKQVTDDTGKCLNMTITDGKNNIVGTVVLLSEKFDGCLVNGMLRSFGINASDVNAQTLLEVCVLYEGRRLGLRDRESLTREITRLHDLCIAKLGEAK